MIAFILKNNWIRLPMFLSIYMIFVGQLCVAQSTTNLELLRKKYSEDNLVRLNQDLNIYIKLENDQIVIIQNSIEEDLFLNESATQYSKESVSYSSFFKLEKLEASSYNLENGKYIEYEVKEFRKKDELEGSFYDDVKSVNFIYPNLNSGSKTKLVVTERVMNPRFLSAFYFGGYYPAINSKLKITVEKGIEINFKEFNTDNINIVFSKKEKNNKTIYSWESKNIDGYKMEDETPNFKNYYPHVIPIITKYKTNSGDVVNLSSEVSDLYNWYYSLTKNINSAPLDKDLKKLVESLIKDKETELEKVKAIYYWVQNNIKYIAFEYALGGFVPREANAIFQKKFGDCKDNSNILFEMLKESNIKGNLTWIGTRSIPYKYSELPTPSVDNHMILTYQYGDSIYFLDATGRYIPIDFPTSFIQGKEALVGNGDKNFKIVEVPIIEGELNNESTKSVININEKNLIGSASKTFSGYRKINLYNKLENLNTPKKIKNYYKEILQNGNNKFMATNEVETNKFDYDKDFKITYDFIISDYVIKASDEIYVNLNLDKILLKYKIESNRETDIEIDYKNTYLIENVLNIPIGYKLDYLPDNISLENDMLSVSIKYEQKDDKILYTHKVKFNFLILKLEYQNEYSNMLKKIEKAYKEVIIIKKNKR